MASFEFVRLIACYTARAHLTPSNSADQTIFFALVLFLRSAQPRRDINSSWIGINITRSQDTASPARPYN